jgi:DNA polymerase-1
MTIIIDGNNLLFRASFSIPAYKNSEGLNIASIYQTLKMIRAYALTYDTPKVYLTWDSKIDYDPERPSFRRELSEGYKQNRPDNNSVYQTVPHIIELLQFMGIPNFFPLRMEADDVISWLSQKIEGPITIISGDKDLLQLINERVKIFNPYQKKEYTLENFEQIFDIPLNKFVLYKCIMGDSSDNIKGLKMFGEKKSKALAKTINSFDDINLPAEQKEIILHNRKILDLSYGWPQDKAEEESYISQFESSLSIKQNASKFKEYARRIEMNQLDAKSSYWLEPFTIKINDVISSWFV